MTSLTDDERDRPSKTSALGQLRGRLSMLGNTHRHDGGLVDRAVARVRRSKDRAWLVESGGLADIAALGRDVASVAPAAGSPRVLVLSLRAWPDHAAIEAVLALALRMRGANVALVTCGGGQPVCELGWPRRAAPRPCDRCSHHTTGLARATSLPAYTIAAHLPWGGDARRAPTSAIDLPLPPEEARHLADVSIPWFLRTSDPASVPESTLVTADFEVAVSGVSAAAERILDDFRPDILFGLNGLFGTERALRAMAIARGVRCPTYERAPRAGALVFSGRPAAEYDTNGSWQAMRDRPLTDAQERALDELLTGRVDGRTSHERYFEAPEADLAVLRRQLAIPDGARVVSLFTNVSWDSACLQCDLAYPSMVDWIAAAVRAVAELPETVLVVRVHPAEERWDSREHAEEEVRARVGSVPPNVRFVASSRALSSYAILDLSDLVLTYTTTVGLEAAVRGIPVAVAGNTHYRGKGFTYDVHSHQDLVAVLRDPPGPMPRERVELARRYAFTFFFRCMVPLPSVEASEGTVMRVPGSAAELQGCDPYLDWSTDRILDGGDFTLPDHLSLPERPDLSG